MDHIWWDAHRPKKSPGLLILEHWIITFGRLLWKTLYFVLFCCSFPFKAVHTFLKTTFFYQYTVQIWSDTKTPNSALVRSTWEIASNISSLIFRSNNTLIQSTDSTRVLSPEAGFLVFYLCIVIYIIHEESS